MDNPESTSTPDRARSADVARYAAGAEAATCWMCGGLRRVMVPLEVCQMPERCPLCNGTGRDPVSGRLPDAARYPAMAGIPETSEGEVIYVHSEQCSGWCGYACNGAEGDRLAAAVNAAARQCPDNARNSAAGHQTK